MKSKKISTALMQLAMMASPFSASAATSAYYSGRRGAYGSGSKTYWVDPALARISKGLVNHATSHPLRTPVLPLTGDGELTLKKASVKEVLVVDQNITDYRQFSRLVKPGVELVEIPRDADGLSFLMHTLAQYDGLNAVHVVSHARAGELLLGNARITADMLKNHTEFAGVVNKAVKTGGDLLLYGCELGKGIAGNEFLEIIKGSTHVDVAASDNLTGNAAFDGDWELEVQKGDIEAKPLANSVAMKDFTEVLQVTTTIDFQNYIADSGPYGPDGYTAAANAQFNVGSYVLTVDGENGYTATFGIDRVYNHGGSTYIETRTVFSFSANATFKPNSITLFNLCSERTHDVTITTDNGGSVVLDNLVSQTDGGTVMVVDISSLPVATQIIITGNIDGNNVDDNSSGAGKMYLMFEELQVDDLGTASSNPSPVIDANGSTGGTSNTTTFTENGAAVPMTTSDATLTDDDNITGMTLVLDAAPNGTSELIAYEAALNSGASLPALGLTGTYVTATRTFTISGTASPAVYQGVLRAMVYNNASDSPNTTARTVTISATDAEGATGQATTTISITAVIAAPSAPDLITSSDSGSSNTDNLTNDTTPTFTGTAGAGAIVRLYANDAEVGSVTADGSGNWTITSTPLDEGTYDITARADDGAGNLSAPSSSLSVTIDLTGPAVSTPDLTDASDSGSSNTDNITNVRRPELTGTAPAGTFIQLFIDNAGNGDATDPLNEMIGTGTAGAGETWSITSTVDLFPGTWSIKARGRDDAGNFGAASPSVNVTIDITPPAAVPAVPDLAAGSDTGSSDSDNITNDTTPTFSGTHTANNVVRLYADGELVGSATASGSGDWTITSDALGAGTYSFTARGVDLAGNEGTASNGLSVTIDPDKPAAPSTPDMDADSDTGSSDSDNNTDDTTPTFSGTGAEANATVYLYVGGVEVGESTADGSGNWSVTVSAGMALDAGDYFVVVRTIDAAGNLSDASGALPIHINTAPTANGNLSQTVSYTEDSGGNVALGDIVVSDIDPGDAITATLTLSDAAAGSLSTGTFGSATSTYNAGTGVWTVTGSVADVNAALAAVAFTPSADNDQHFTITTRIRDAAGTGPADGTISVTVTPVNDAPVVTAPATITVTEDVATALTGISFADVDAGSGTITVTLSVPSGSLSATSGANVTVGGASSDLTLTGTIADVNAFIAASNVTYTTVLNATESATLSVSINDSGNTGTGGAQEDSGTVTLTITAVNDAPTVSAPATIGVDEDLATALTGISFSDVDAGSGNATATLSVPSGSLSAISGSEVTVGGTASALTLTGTMANINAFFAASNVTYTTALNATANVTLTVDINDNGNTGAGGSQSANETITLEVTAANDAPVLDDSASPALNGVAEDAAAATNGSTAGSTLVSALTGGISDADAGASQGIAVIATSAQGTLWYSLDGGTTWIAVPSVSEAAALLLQTDVRVYFQPASDVSGTISDALTFRAWDRTMGSNGGMANTTTNGGGSAFSTASDVVSIAITAVNDAPTATNLTQTKTAGEGGPAVALDDIVVTDVDAGETITATLTMSDPAAGSMSTGTFGSATSTYNAGTGVWTVTGSVPDVNAALAAVAFMPSADNDQNFTITTHIEDAAGTGPTDGTISFTVTPVNDAPVIDPSVALALDAINEDTGSPMSGVASGTPVSALAGGISDVDTDALKGIAIISANAGNGTWWFTTDAGASWSALGSPSEGGARLLAANTDTRLHFQPDADWNGTLSAALTVRAWDLSAGSNGGLANIVAIGTGGTMPFSTATVDVSLVVNAVNDEPTVTTSAASAVAATSATLGGEIIDDGGAMVTARGIVWNITGDPTTADHNVPAATGGTGVFSNPVGLPAGKTIFVRAYATNAQGTAYGDEIEITTPAATPPGNSLHFNGSTAYVQVNSAGSTATDFNGASSFTIEAWVHLINFGGPSNNPAIFAHKNNMLGGYSLIILTNNGTPYFEGSNGNSFVGVSGTTSIKTGEWTHVAVSFDAGAVTFYVNGEEAGEGTLNIAPINLNSMIGALSNGGSKFNGAIDELKVWNAIRSKEQIRAGMTGITDPGSTNLVLYYDADQGIPEGTNTALTTLYDRTSNGFNGTLNGFALTGTTTNWKDSYAMVVPVAAAASNVETDKFTANWSAPVNGEVDSYLLEVATDEQFTTFLSGYQGKDVGAVSSAEVTGLNSGTIYYYRVRASDEGVIGGASTAIVVTTEVPITPDENNILYINQDVAGGNGSGDSWENAIPELADALKWAEENKASWTAANPLQIWIAKGIYKPLYEVVTSGDARDKGFKLVQNVQLYGGFDPANGIVDLGDERLLPNPASAGNEGTVLSGDMDNNDQADGTIVGDNAYHVVLALGVSGGPHIDEITVLDGFTVTGGKADNSSSFNVGYDVDRDNGGGMFFAYAYPTVRHVLFRQNQAEYGGGIAVRWADGPPLVLTSVSLVDNQAIIYGGGIYGAAGDIQLTGTLLAGNHAGANNSGGGIFMDSDGTLQLANITVADNTTGAGGARGMYVSAGTAIALRNSLIWSNDIVGTIDDGSSDYNIIGSGGTMFADAATNDYRLAAGSTAVNAGDPAIDLSVFPGGPGAAEDLGGTMRLQGGTIDVGAFESAYEDADEVDNVPPIAVTTAYGTALNEVTIPEDFTAEVTLTDGSVEEVEVDPDTDNWLLTSGTYDGEVAGTYTFEVPLILPEITETPWFTNTQGLKAAVAVTVNKGTPTWSVALGGETAADGSTLNRTYGDAEQLTFDLSDWDGDAEDITFNITEGEELVDISGFPMLQGIGVGTVEVEVTLPETDNYESDVATFTVEIAPKTIAVVPVADQTKVYGAADPTDYGYELAVGSELVTGDAWVDIVSGTSREAGEDVGAYDIVVTFEGTKADNYDITFDTDNNAFAITPKALTITADAGQGKVYGSDDPVLVFTAAGFERTDDESILTGALARESGEDVDTYAIAQGTLDAGGNYTIDYTGADFEITPATLMVTVNAGQGKVYGSDDPVLSFTATGFERTDDESVLTGALERAPGEDTGDYAITQGMLDAGGNYTIDYTGADFAITPKTLTVTTDAGQGKVYGSDDPVLTFAATGFELTDDENILTGALVREAGEDVDTYAIAQGTLDAGGNYTIDYTGADFAITPATLTITANAGQGKVYGSADPVLTFAATGFALTDDESILTGALVRETGEEVGDYAIRVGDLSAGGNYTIAYASSDFAITPKTLTITADAGQGKVYGSADPALAYSATGFELSDDESILTGALSRESGEDVGDYAITQGTLDAGNNYTIAYAAADFTITPLAVTVTAADRTKVFGQADPELAYTVAPALVAGDTFTGTLEREPGEAVGIYEITKGTLALSDNYTLTFNGAELEITPSAALEVTLRDGSFVYDGGVKSLAIEGELPEGTSVSYANNGRTDVGSQMVTATIDGGNNYDDLVLTATLEITPAERTLSFPALPDKTYGDADFSGGATASSGEAVSYTSSNPAVAEITATGLIRITGAGEATITATVPENGNYSNRPQASQPLTVNKAGQAITFNAPAEVNRDAGSIQLDVTASSGLPVSLTIDDEQVATLDGTTLNIHRLGTINITAVQEGDGNYEAAEPVTVTIRVVDPSADFAVRIHPAVSPNGDGINEFLMIEGIRDYPENRVTVVTKNGTVVYEAEGYDNNNVVFRGRGTGGINLAPGTYFYIVEVKINGRWAHKKGYFVLRY